MSQVYVSRNDNPAMAIEVDLQNSEWSVLHVDNIPSFKIEEVKRPCDIFPDGLFPGAKSNGENKQITQVSKFRNYMEFSKVVEDEVRVIQDNSYLTTKFFERRAKGWSQSQIQKKNGKILGYCLNGNLHHKEDCRDVEKNFYLVVYSALIKDLPPFLRLKDYLSKGYCLILKGMDQPFLDYLSQILLREVG